MSSSIRAALMETLAPHLGLGKSRLETLAALVIGIVTGRTVNLSHAASLLHGAACHGSKYRRLQRFFQYIALDQAVISGIVVRMLDLGRPKCLAIDRTNWKVGTRDINILVLAIVTRRFRVPVFWTVLDHPGNSDSAQRMALMKRYLAAFGASSISLLLADREFIGADWMNFLNENNIPFAIRVKADMRLALADGRVWSLKTLLRTKRTSRTIRTLQGRLPNTNLSVNLAAKWIADKEWLIVMTNSADPVRALRTYKRRWGIECLFGDTKTRGLNIEDTHITNPTKIATLVAVLALAITWAYRCATQTLGMKAIKRKAHGRREKSWFRTGLDALRSAIVNSPQSAILAWTQTCPKRKLT
jgi:hypothetical protein